MAPTAASHPRRLLAGLVLAVCTAPAPAADPPPTAPPPTPDTVLARTLGDVRRDAFRNPPDPAGAEAVTALFARSFRQLGLFPAAVGTAQVVTQDDFDQLEAVAARSLTTRREVLSALDDWMFLLEQSGGGDERFHPTLKLLRDHAGRLETDEPGGPPLRRVRQAVAARDQKELLAVFEGEQAVGDDLLRRLPGRLLAQAHTVLANPFHPAAPRVLEPFARLRPADPAANALLARTSRTPAQASRHAYALLLTDPDNPAHHSLLGQILLAAAVRPDGRPLPSVRTFEAEYDSAAVGEAIVHLEGAVRLNADQKRLDPAAHHHLGVAHEYSREWRSGKAVVAFEAAVRDAALLAPPADAAVYQLDLARALQNLGRDPNRVIREAERCIKLCQARPQPPAPPGPPPVVAAPPPQDSGPDELAQAHVVVGRAYLDLGRAADATTSFAAAVQLRPTTASVWFWLGRAYFACGEVRHAVEATTYAHTRDRSDPEILAALGTYALAEGNAVAAKKWFGQAKELANNAEPLSAWHAGRPLPTDDGIEQADELAALQRVVTDLVACENAKPTLALLRAAAAGKRYTLAARTYQSLLSQPDFGDETGEPARLAVGAAVRAGRDGLCGDTDRERGADAFHALARRWADDELNRVRAQFERLAKGDSPLDRERLLDRVGQFQTDPLLAAVREPYLRARLGAAEQRSWESFWDAWNETVLAVRGLPTGELRTGGKGAGGLGGF